MANRVCVIVNPTAGRGRGARALPQVRTAFATAGVSEVCVTTPHDSEYALARRAIGEGFTTLVAVGGDGTWSNVANAILHAGAGADVRLGIIAAGTGNDFAKSVNAPAHDAARTAQLAVAGPDRCIDVGRVEDRFFLNALGFGFDVAVIEDVSRIRWLRGDALYVYSALRQLRAYRGVQIDVRSAARARAASNHLMLVIANARRFGGTFLIAPRASLSDGLLDVVAIGDASTMRRLQLFGAAVRGTHDRFPEVDVEQTPALELHFATPPAYETDGEYHRAESAALKVDCVPGALRLLVA